MNTEGLIHVLNGLNEFGGVTSVDRLTMKERNKFYIVNTDPSYKPGKHWVCIFLSNVPEFFDSLGQPPLYYDRRFERFVIIQGPTYMYNSKRIQSYGSDSCGHYCIYYVVKRAMGFSMRDIVNEFSSTDLLSNDNKVQGFYSDLLRRLN